MAVHAKRVRGLIFFKIDGAQYSGRGSAEYKLSKPKNAAFANLDNSMSIGSEPKLGYIKISLNNYQSVDVGKIEEIEGATVTLEVGNGKMAQAKDAVQTGECGVNAETGEFEVMFESDDVEEITA